jgi:hypothetical protein
VPPYFDVDGDGGLTATDVVLVINYLNAKAAAGGEDVQSVDVNPTASAARSSDAASATGTASTADDDASGMPLPGPAGESSEDSSPLANSDANPFNYADYGPANHSFGSLPLTLPGQDDHDDLDDLIPAGANDKESDDFFAWFGQ